MANKRFELNEFSPPEIDNGSTKALQHGVARRPDYSDWSSYSYGYGDQSGSSPHLLNLWRKVWRHKWLVAAVVLIVNLIIGIWMYRTKPWYRASTVIEVGKENKGLLKSGDVIINDDADPYYLVYIKTKKLMLHSPELYEDVILKLRLDQNPRFLDSTRQRSLLSSLRSLFKEQKNTSFDEASAQQLGLELKRSPLESARLAPFVEKLQDNLSVDQIKDTRSLKISFTHTDPMIAAAVANGLATGFMERNFQGQTEKFTTTIDWLDRSTNELKSKVEEAEQALASYTRTHGIFSTENKGGDSDVNTLTTEKLTRLHDQFLRAQTDRMLKESLHEQVTSGRVAQLPDAFTDPKIIALQKNLNELATAAAELKVKYGPMNPKIAEINKQMESLREQMAASYTSLEEKFKTDYERAVRDEQSLKRALDQAKAEAVTENQASIQYNILKQNLETSRALYQEFLQKANQARTLAAEQYNNMRIIQNAQVPVEPSGPRRLLTLMIGIFLSLGVGICFAFLLDHFDHTVRNVEDVSRYAQLPVLGIIPKINGGTSRLIAANINGHRKALAGGNGSSASIRPYRVETEPSLDLYQYSSAAEAYRSLRTSVLLSETNSPPKTILVTSGQPGDGKTTTAINTAMFLAQLGAGVLIIDGDLRIPRVHQIFGVNNERGLSTHLSNGAEIVDLIQNLPIQNLSLLPSGPIPHNPAELLSSQRMKEMLHILADIYDHIVIDSPPLVSVTDPVVLSTLVDAVLLVVRSGRTTRDVVQHSCLELSRVGANVHGVVLNNFDLRRERYGYFKTYDSGSASRWQAA